MNLNVEICDEVHRRIFSMEYFDHKLTGLIRWQWSSEDGYRGLDSVLIHPGDSSLIWETILLNIVEQLQCLTRIVEMNNSTRVLIKPVLNKSIDVAEEEKSNELTKRSNVMVWRSKEYRPGSRRRSFPCSWLMLNRSIETSLTRIGDDTTSRNTVEDDWSFGYPVIVTVSVSWYDPCDSVWAGINRSFLSVSMSWSAGRSPRQLVEQWKIFQRVGNNNDREQFNLIVDVMRIFWVRRNFNDTADGTNRIKAGKQSKVSHNGKTSVITKEFFYRYQLSSYSLTAAITQ